MKLTFNIKIAALILLIHLLVVGLVAAQSTGQRTSSGEIYKEISKMDSILFTAFNTRDTNQFKKMFTDDLEFYHDKGGLTGFKETLDFMRSTTQADNGLKRELLPGTLEVYPIPGYGAMEIGSHRFCHTENGKQDCGTFKFVHIWKNKDGTWKISRVVSYDH